MKIDNRYNEIAKIAMNKVIWFMINMSFDNVTYELPWNGEKVTEWLPVFLGKVKWGCNTEHIVNKWKTYSGVDPNLAETFVRFYSGLDTKNSRALLDYIIEAYDNERNLPINY